METSSQGENVTGSNGASDVSDHSTSDRSTIDGKAKRKKIINA
ncbi:MAG: hypothetical protein OXC61_10330 [Flavobacteriaceae bacterium]|nr:hypothetical protein [Flavobacteriaceae bacterium]MCY4299679.1 hypothetical protein [Flavobacteriaceae bacterium]